MPLPKPLSEIKNDLQGLLAINEIAKTISTLQGLLPNSAEKRSQTILLEGRLSQISRDHNIAGIVKLDDFQVETNRIRDAMLKLVTGLEEKDFDPAAAGASAQPPVTAVPKFVIIYAQEDADYAKMLNKHLNVLKFTKKIRVYDVNNDIKAGENVAGRAQEEMADADYLVALITVDLLSSEWFGVLYEAMGQGRRVIPLNMKKADFEDTGLEKLKSLPTMNRAVSEFANPDDAYLNIVTELRKLLPK